MEGTQENTQQSALIGWGESRRLNRRQLTNRLNAINFQGGEVLVTLRHRRFDQTTTLGARPYPCSGTAAEFSWVDSAAAAHLLDAYAIEEMVIADGLHLLRVTPELLEIGAEGFRLRLPEFCNQVRNRETRRYPATEIEVELLQNGAVFTGTLVDFNAVSFHLILRCSPPVTFQWLHAGLTAMLVLKADGAPCYTGLCRILRQGYGQQHCSFVFEPLQDQTQRFKPKKFRSERLELVPSPDIRFRHPLTGRMIQRKVLNISGSGFAVREQFNDAVLPVGLIISHLELGFANTLRMTCSAQVVHRRVTGDEVTCGLAILDMATEEHVHLLGLLQQARDECAYVCNSIDVDALWEFFFATGFIYPEKYAFIQGNKEKFKETYVKLYTQNPSIAHHFVYQENGRILGHMAMLRDQENSWLIHHHAADTLASKKAGLVVLSQIGRYINDSHNLYSTHMNFVMCYFRPENKFPRRVFGGVAQAIANPKGCSTDTFVYFHHLRAFAEDWLGVDPAWQLSTAQNADLEEFEHFYEHDSGGLMVPALSLETDTAFSTSLAEEYHRLGFRKERQILVLKHDGRLKALLLVNRAELGLNLAELTDSIQIFIVDAEGLQRRLLDALLSHVCASHERDEAPVLLYPVAFAEREKIPYDKRYTLWILNCRYTDDYFQFCNTFLERF